MNIRWYKAKTVMKARNLTTPEQVFKRLKEIRDNPKSSYHKALKEDRLSVLYHHMKERPFYTIQEIEAMDAPIGNAVCGECLGHFFALDDDDYLCPSCRELTET